jgi:hypothetical protein
MLGIAIPVTEPSADMGRYFTETFNRRTGKPLAIVAGEPRIAALVALASPDRPHVFTATGASARENEIREKGAILLWPATDVSDQPPEEIRSRFPELVAEVPRAFERTVQGRAPLLRVGWGVIRPGSGPSAAAR